MGIAMGASLTCLALAPALAEDTGRWEALMGVVPGFRQAAPAPGFRIVLPPPAHLTRPKPQVVRLSPEPALVIKSAVPPDPAKRENPLVAILNDSTLRHGDIVVFPDGPRVFKGRSGERHSVHDFVAVARSKDMPKARRKLLLAMPIGENDAWSSEARRSNRIAGRIPDVETNGSIGKTETVRTGRGDVRVIRVPD
jgi:hypothetical protein